MNRRTVPSPSQGHIDCWRKGKAGDNLKLKAWSECLQKCALCWRHAKGPQHKTTFVHTNAYMKILFLMNYMCFKKTCISPYHASILFLRTCIRVDTLPTSPYLDDTYTPRFYHTHPYILYIIDIHAISLFLHYTGQSSHTLSIHIMTSHYPYLSTFEGRPQNHRSWHSLSAILKLTTSTIILFKHKHRATKLVGRSEGQSMRSH